MLKSIEINGGLLEFPSLYGFVTFGISYLVVAIEFCILHASRLDWCILTGWTNVAGPDCWYGDDLEVECKNCTIEK
jgi:hypothetical protein